MVPKCNHTCPYKREAEGELTHTGDNITTEAEIRVMRPQAKESWQPLESGSIQEWILPENFQWCGLANPLILSQ